MSLLHSCPKWTLKQGQFRREIYKTQTLPNLTQEVVTFRKSWPKSFTNRISVYQSSTVYETDSPAHWNPIGPHQDSPAGCDIAQQYTSASFVSSLHFYSFPQEYIWRAFQEVHCVFLYYFLKTEWVCNCLSPGMLEILKSTVENWSFVVKVPMANRI